MKKDGVTRVELNTRGLKPEQALALRHAWISGKRLAEGMEIWEGEERLWPVRGKDAGKESEDDEERKRA